jgi:hypothetical protein
MLARDVLPAIIAPGAGGNGRSWAATSRPQELPPNEETNYCDNQVFHQLNPEDRLDSCRTDSERSVAAASICSRVDSMVASAARCLSPSWST